MQEITTTDFSRFGARGRGMAKDLLQAWEEHGLPEDFEDNEVAIMMNTYSGNVFLTNSEYQVAMVTDSGELESFYTTPYNGVEGFWNDLVEEYKDMCAEDQEYMRDIANGRDLPSLE